MCTSPLTSIFRKDARLIARLLLMALLWTATPAMAGDKLILAVHPYLPAHELIRNFQPLADHLALAIGRSVEVDISPNYSTHIERIGKDEVSIAYMGPIPFIRLTALYGDKPILAKLEVRGETRFRGHIVVRQQDPITMLADLKGKRFAFGNLGSTMGYTLPLYMLHQTGIDTSAFSEYKFLNSHHNAAMSVLAGDFDAGALKEEVFLKYQNRGLRVLASTPPIPTHLFVVSSKLQPELVQQLRQIMLKLSDDPESQTILSSIQKGTTALRHANNSDYDTLRTILTTVDALKVAADGQR